MFKFLEKFETPTPVQLINTNKFITNKMQLLSTENIRTCFGYLSKSSSRNINI